MNCSNLTAENGVKLFAHQAVIFVLVFFFPFGRTMQLVYHDYTVLTQLQNVNTTF